MKFIAKVTVQQEREALPQWSPKLSRWRATKLMKALNIMSCQQPGHRYKKASEEHIEIPNYLDRQFAVTGPNQVWCGDVTYIWT